MKLYYCGSFLISFLSVMVLVPPVRRWAVNIGFLDRPAGVKDHKEPIPLGGGLAVFIGSIIIVTVLAVALGFSLPRTAIGILAGTVLMFLIGLYDDYYEIGALGKIFGQVTSALIFLTFVEMHPLIISMPAYVIIMTLWIIGLQNAINFIDNLDGQCSGISLTIAMGFGILFILKGMPIFAIMSFALAGGALGFLRYNLSPAKIFLGDGGSLLFGFALSCLGVVHLNTSKTMAGALAPLLIMAFPIFDMTLVTIARLNKGRRLYVASKDHAWDMIKILGLTSEATVYVILSINMILVVSGIAIFFMEDVPYQTLVVIAFALVLAFIGTQLYRNFLYLKDRVISVLVDLGAINFAFVLYCVLKYRSGLMEHTIVLSPETLAIPLAWINAFWIILYAATGLYDISYETRFTSQFRILSKSILIGTIIFLAANYNPETGLTISLTSIAVFILLLLATNTMFRAILHTFLIGKFRNPYHKLNAIIVNPGRKSSNSFPLDLFCERYNIVGYAGPEGIYDLKHFGELRSLTDILRNNKAARVILDIADDYYQNIGDIFKSAFFMETVFLIGGHEHENLKGLKKYRTNNNEIYMISIRHRGLFSQLLKRLVDFALSTFAIALTSPYILARFFNASRKGEKIVERGRMKTTEKREDYIRYSYGKDSAGKLRSWWALLSILKGDLSLYGTTITSVDEHESLANSIPGYWRKFLVKPGLFGPGYRGKSPSEIFALDLIYMEKTSFFGDIIMAIRQLFGMPLLKDKGLNNA